MQGEVIDQVILVKCTQEEVQLQSTQLATLKNCPAPHFSLSHEKTEIFVFVMKISVWIKHCLSEGEKMKMKGFSNPRVCCRFKFEFLNLPKRLREFSVEASERHFSRISWSNSVQHRPGFLQVFQACSNYKCFSITHNSCFCQIHMTLLHGNLLWLIKHQWNYFYTLHTWGDNLHRFISSLPVPPFFPWNTLPHPHLACCYPLYCYSSATAHFRGSLT